MSTAVLDQDAAIKAGAPTALDDLLVVKLGGGADIDPQPLLQELATRQAPWILVHGGNERLSALSRALGHAPRFVTSPSGHESRVTDATTIEHIQMTYRGVINNDLVARLQRLGCQAVGLSGVDGNLWQAKRKDAIRIVEDGRKRLLRDDLTGRITGINTHLLTLLLENGYRPVLTLPALADDGSLVNVDGDRAAAALATAMGASTLVNLSNVPGLLRDVHDPTSRIDAVPRHAIDDVKAYAKGRYTKKILGVEEALAGGVSRVVLASAKHEAPLHAALGGDGTVFS